MRTRGLIIATLLCVLAASPVVTYGGEPAPRSGTVTQVHPPRREVHLGQERFVVPTGVQGFEELTPGLYVVLYLEEGGEDRTVTRIELLGPR